MGEQKIPLTKLHFEFVDGRKNGKLKQENVEVPNNRVSFVGSRKIEYLLYPLESRIPSHVFPGEVETHIERTKFLRQQEISKNIPENANAYASSKRLTLLGKLGLYCQERILFYNITNQP